MGEHDAGEPFAGPVNAIGGEEPGEGRRDGRAGADEEPVAGVECDVNGGISPILQGKSDEICVSQAELRKV